MVAGKPRLVAAELSTTTDTAIEAGAGEGDGFDGLKGPDESEDVEDDAGAEELPLWPPAAFEAPPEAGALPGRSAPAAPSGSSALVVPLLVPETSSSCNEGPFSDAPPLEDELSDGAAFSAFSDEDPSASAFWTAGVPVPSTSVPYASVALGPEGKAPGRAAFPVRGKLAFPASSSSESARPAAEQRPKALPARSRCRRREPWS